MRLFQPRPLMNETADAMVSAAREHIRSIHETARFIEEAEQEINRLLGES